MRFRENECKFCKQVFCCRKCRLKHETTKHKINFDCDICNCGYLIQRNLKETILEHLRNVHWPLHCVFCKYTFRTVADLEQHTICSLAKEDSPITPYRNPTVLGNSDDSPILAEQQFKNHPPSALKLVTSTPMLRNDNAKDFNKNNEMITPVEHNTKPADNTTQLPKRRVTFCEVLAVDTPEREPEDVKQNKLFSEGVSELCTPQRAGTTENEEQQMQFYTPGKFEEYVGKPDEELEFSTPARFSNDQSDSSGKEMEKIMSKIVEDAIETPARHNNASISDQSDSSVEEMEKITSKIDEETIETLSRCNNGNMVDQNDSSTKEMEKIMDQEAMETPSKHDNGSNDDHRVSPAKELEKISSKMGEKVINGYEDDIFEENLALKDSSTIWMSALCLSASSSSDEVDTQNESDENSSPPEITKSPPLKLVCPTPVLKNTVEKDESTFEDKENITINSPALSKLLKIHPTPHPILKNRDVNIAVLESSETNTPNMTAEKSPEKKIVKVQPTPIIKQTNIHMKFRIPSHFSSTPILNMHPQPKLMKKVLTQQIVMHQGEKNYCETSTTAMLQQINQSESISEIDREPSTQEENRPNLWASMTKIMKRVIERTVSFSSDSYSISQEIPGAIAGTSFKRHFSESDSDLALTPQVKRFKFTDIKCRRPIRDLSPPRPGRMLALPGTTGGTTFEIVKSVTTSQGIPIRKTYVDKATQTDDDFFVQY